MKPYEPLAESGEPTSQQQAALGRLRAEHDWTEHALLADGRLRVYVLDTRGIIAAIHYIAPDGSEQVER